MKLCEEPRTTFQRRNTRYRGGMHVEASGPTARPPSKAS